MVCVRAVPKSKNGLIGCMVLLHCGHFMLARCLCFLPGFIAQCCMTGVDICSILLLR
jgi:hypothetical protein